jgi:hypothetical protein
LGSMEGWRNRHQVRPRKHKKPPDRMVGRLFMLFLEGF